ncbi:MAG: tetratricopeptide repeat protein [Leptospirales bacterium]|nr:tetratricopeptide repeat protein [Leptospirales bacterium]
MKRITIKINLIIAILFIMGNSNVYSESKNLFNQGLEAFKVGNYASAELLFRKTVESNDEYRDRGWFYLARTIYQQGKYKPAIFEFNSFLTKCRTESLRIESRFWIGECYYNLKENLKAIEEYTRFLEKSTDSDIILTAHDRIASIYYNQNRYEEAIIEWETAIKKNSDKMQNAEFVLKIGDALFKNEKYDNALERLNPLLSSKIDTEKKAEVRLIIGRIYQLQNEDKKALLVFNAIPSYLAETYPFWDVYYFRAMSYLNTDRESLAKTDLELFSIIGKKSEFYYDGLYEYGKVLLNSSKPENGIDILEKVWENQDRKDLSVKSALLMADFFIEKEPQRSITYLENDKNYEDEELRKSIIITLSKAYFKNENFDKAESMLKIYLSAYPYDPNIDEVKFIQARILLEKDDVEGATQIFNDLKMNNPFSKFLNDTDYYLALVSIKKGKKHESITLLKRYAASKNANYSFDAHRLLTELYLESEDIKNAETEVNILLNSFSNYTGVDKLVYKLALAMGEKNNQSSTKYFNILQNRYPDSKYAMLINVVNGNKFFANKNYSRAITYYEKFLNSNIDESRGTAYYNLVQSYFNLKEYNKVIDIIKNIKIPPLDEHQWQELPLIQARSFYLTSQFNEVYSLLKWEDIKTFNDDDAGMLIDCTIKTGDIASAEKFINQLKNREALYFEQMLIFGKEHKTRKNNAKAEEIFNTILNSNSSAKIKEGARIELAIIKMEAENYNASLNYLNQIELNDYIPERDSLIIMNQFYLGKEKSGAETTDARLKFILNNRFTEKVLLLNLDYHFKEKNLNSFLKYANLLKPYRVYDNYIDYHSALLYYETGDYQKSYNSFYKLSLSENEYTTEMNYYLGRLNLLYNKNKSTAIKYFLKVVELNVKNDFINKSRLELGILYYEMKNNEYAYSYLNEVISDNPQGKFRIEAENLLEYFKLAEK